MIRFIKKKMSFNASRVRLMEENEAFASSIPEGALVLDAGAGDQPYKHLLEHTQYEAADFEKVDKEYAKSTYVCDLADIPVEDNRFDYILFNQVMEHLPEPMNVLYELNRVLKPGGKIIYTAPFFYEEHEQPYDFFRYTQFSVKRMFDKAGFNLEKFEWLEGYFGTVGYQFNRMARYLPTSPKELGGGVMGVLRSPIILLLKVHCAIFSVVFNRLETKHKYTKRGYPKNYVGIFQKKS